MKSLRVKYFALLLGGSILLLIGCGGDKKNPTDSSNTFLEQFTDRWWSRQGFGEGQTKDYYFASRGTEVTVTRYQGGFGQWNCEDNDSPWEPVEGGAGKVLWDSQVKYFEIEEIGSAGVRLLQFNGDSGTKGELEDSFLPEDDLAEGPRECCPGCPGPGQDVTPPTVIANLRAMPWGITSIRLSWTAPADEGPAGKAVEYEIRSSSAAITESNWHLATGVSGEPTPGTAGQAQSFVVELVGNPDSRTFLVIRSRDEVRDQWSQISNNATAFGSPPANDLAIGTVTDGSIELNWTAPGDPGSAPTIVEYDIRYANSSLTKDTWQDATRAVAAPAILAPGEPEAITVTGLAANTRYFLALRIRVEGGDDWSSLSPVVIRRTATSQ